MKEVPELEAVEDARMGMTEDKMCLDPTRVTEITVAAAIPGLTP